MEITEKVAHGVAVLLERVNVIERSRFRVTVDLAWPRIVNRSDGSDSEAIGHGAAYLTVMAPAVFFEFYNKIASRTFAGIGDTFTPMLIRGGGAIVNILLSVVFIFWAGLGVVGAAYGTVTATVLVTIALMWGLVGKAYPQQRATSGEVRALRSARRYGVASALDRC